MRTTIFVSVYNIESANAHTILANLSGKSYNFRKLPRSKSKTNDGSNFDNIKYQLS